MHYLQLISNEIFLSYANENAGWDSAVMGILLLNLFLAF